MDDDFDDIVPRLKALECDNLEIVALEGADHYFTGRVDDFIELIDYI
jgi:alpha/beta superfamily hydrolase